MDTIDFKLKAGSLHAIIGPSNSGKSTLALSLLKRRHEIFDIRIDRCYYINTHWQPAYQELALSDPNVIFSTSLETVKEQAVSNCIIVFDDVTSLKDKNSKANKFLEELALHGAHHRNITVIYFLFQLFHPALRTITLSTAYFTIFDFCRDRSSVAYFSRQICPSRSKFLTDAFLKAVEGRDFGYLHINLHPHHKTRYWVRSEIFPSENTEIYIAKE